MATRGGRVFGLITASFALAMLLWGVSMRESVNVPGVVPPPAGGPPIGLIFGLFFMGSAVWLLTPVMRAWAKSLERGAADPEMLAELRELRERVGELDEVHAHVQELEERVAFTERLLSASHPADKLELK